MIEAAIFILVLLVLFVKVGLIRRRHSEEMPQIYSPGLDIEGFEYYRALQMERISKLMMQGDSTRTHLDCNNPDSYFYKQPVKLEFENNLATFRIIWGKYEQNLIDSYRTLLKHEGTAYPKLEYIKGSQASLECTIYDKKGIENYMKFALPLELHLFELDYVKDWYVPDNINILRIAGAHRPINHTPVKIV